MSKIIIFIESPWPTEADLALGEKLGTKRFRNVQEASGGTERCSYAAAVDPSIIPEGYATSEAPEVDPEAPVTNPTAPVAKVAPSRIMVPKG